MKDDYIKLHKKIKGRQIRDGIFSYIKYLLLAVICVFPKYYFDINPFAKWIDFWLFGIQINKTYLIVLFEVIMIIYSFIFTKRVTKKNRENFGRGTFYFLFSYVVQYGSVYLIGRAVPMAMLKNYDTYNHYATQLIVLNWSKIGLILILAIYILFFIFLFIPLNQENWHDSTLL